MPQIERDVFDRGELILDERHFPVVIATWVGEVTDEGIDAYYRWYDRVIRRAAIEGIRVVPITDLLRTTGGVDPAQRRRFVEETDRREAMLREHVDHVMVVAQGAFALGLIAFVLCSMRRGIRLSTYSELQGALERALQRLDAVGVPRPSWLDPADYAPSTWRRAVA